MRKIKRTSLVVAILFLLGAGALQISAKPHKPGPCPSGSGCGCPLYYDPVTCDGGCRYTNSCIARCAGATGCVSNPN